MEVCATNEWRNVVEVYAQPMLVLLQLASLNLLGSMDQFTTIAKREVHYQVLSRRPDTIHRIVIYVPACYGTERFLLC